MTRWPIRACFSLTPAPIAATTPQGSCPAMTGSGLTGSPLIEAPPLGRRYWCRSLPHMPDAFISTTTSPGPGAGSGNAISSISRSPMKTTPRIAASALPPRNPRSAYAVSRRVDSAPPPRRAAVAESLGKPGTEKQDLRRVVHPHENRHERARRAIGRGDAAAADIEADEMLADGEEQRRRSRADPHIPPLDGGIRQNLEHHREQDGGEAEGQREVDNGEDDRESRKDAVEIPAERFERRAQRQRDQQEKADRDDER